MHFNEKILANTATMNPADNTARQTKQVSQPEKKSMRAGVLTDFKSRNKWPA